jgi:hypothetical protein
MIFDAVSQAGAWFPLLPIFRSAKSLQRQS